MENRRPSQAGMEICHLSFGIPYCAIDPIIVSFMVTWLYALTRKRKACGLNLIIVPATICVHLMIVCCHKTMGGYQFGNRYIVDMLPYVFYGLITYKQGVWKAEWLNNLLFALGFSINLIGTVSTYNHWI